MPAKVMAAYRRVYVTCRLTAKDRNQLRNPTLGNRVSATFTLLVVRSRRSHYRVEPLNLADHKPKKNNAANYLMSRDHVRRAAKILLYELQLLLLFLNKYKSVFSLVNSAVNMTLPAFAAERRAAVPLLLGGGTRRCRSMCPACGALSSKPAAHRSCCLRRTDGHPTVT